MTRKTREDPHFRYSFCDKLIMKNGCFAEYAKQPLLFAARFMIIKNITIK